MPRCKICGAEIDDTQSSEFGEMCPACVRLQRGSRNDEQNSSGEAMVWLLIMIVSCVYAVGSLLAPLVFVSLLPSMLGFDTDISTMVLMFSMPNVVFGVLGIWFGHHMYRKTSSKANS